MGVTKISSTTLPLMAAITLTILLLLSSQVCYAQNAPQDYINAHNNARSKVGVGPMTWNTTLASFAQNYTNKLKESCNLVHSGGPYGENLAGSSGDLTGTAAVNLWVAEKQYYHYNSNSCDSGKVCGHYTQVVWRSSIHLGCAKERCKNGGTVISCNYAPRGNIIGRKPY
ncbi:hypothetical protein HN51_030531 [Arachis hypogaea]|uniref:SCP domain-containing protein n=3 Tax=Arachis TaxID=3817 RepID=A0A445BAV7_ARAHY|nr:pathogenesis-related protein 1 [Arachis duranensis]XP_025622194.1 pathogenesis-related protein 1 [Arachis hypogaea]RYR35823.1 hypothetical protein Ahy_A10g050922 isoform A [Arachis hypogaea]